MLEKNHEICYFDAHFHYFDCQKLSILPENSKIFGCSCSHSVEEWKVQSEAGKNILKAFGIHPQNAALETSLENVDFLEKLLLERNNVMLNHGDLSACLSAIGEAGFDFFSEQLKKNSDIQEKYWNLQLELAEQYKIPLVVHCRKSNEKLFEYSSRLKKLPAVLFHSFMGNSVEAKSLLSRGINGFFSFGKQIFNNNKKVHDCVCNLPVENLLCETDAPFQFLKNEAQTFPEEIKKIYKGFYDLKKTNSSFEDFCFCLENNYNRLFFLEI